MNKMSSFHLVDDREHALIPLLHSSRVELNKGSFRVGQASLPNEASCLTFGKQFRASHLPVGDVWIGLDCSGSPAPNGIIIERKAAADLEASILDGRYKEQRARLLAFAQERKAHPAYIIEGDLDRFNARLKKPALMKHITRLAIRYHIPVFQTACIQETAELCELLADQWGSDPTTFDSPASLSYVETRGVTREANTDDPKVFAVTVLSACRGVSAAGAKAVLEGCGGTLEGVWRASVTELAAIQTGKQKLGKVKAERLWGLLHSSQPVPSA